MIVTYITFNIKNNKDSFNIFSLFTAFIMLVTCRPPPYKINRSGYYRLVHKWCQQDL